jgi:TIR domain
VESAKPVICFISHSSKDAEFAESIEQVLGDHGVEAYLSFSHMKGGRPWMAEVGAALDRCQWVLLILSADARKSANVDDEIGAALVMDKFRGRIIPLWHRGRKLMNTNWYPLLRVHHVDFRKSFDDGCEQLLSVWGIPYIAVKY